MKESRYYIVAGHGFCVEAEADCFCVMQNYEPFRGGDQTTPGPSYSGGELRVYGSPWSGKTPCYRNVSYPLGGIVLLSQAPYNKIERLKGLQAYAALVMSISGKRWDARIADGLHATEERLAANVPMWHLECLPDRAAAVLCQLTVESYD